ncbi:UDP-2,3-diacylglucosamine diphosphatase [Legionella sp. CNM-4043-24]|uniref:UDP-2,3-diacylglucosamine diphosphatase n=1 Tax=Legionella sp. CNM-4043-24 TaxID=3421646 RepID=UPI00403AE64B
MTASTSNEPRLDAVFISDLHLHPNNPEISERFNAFIDWAAAHTRVVYILGDFFHVWPGDDGLTDWSTDIASRLASLSGQGVQLYFMPGNRDFLIGQRFADLARMTLLTEPTVIQLDDLPVLLVHGDRYCTKDRGHQYLRALTRNRLFTRLFLSLPLALRNRVVAGVRRLSTSRTWDPVAMDVVPEVVLAHMQACQVQTLIHGHTHKPGVSQYEHAEKIFSRYVLSDWDDKPKLLCYHNSKGLYFVHDSFL